MEYLVTRSGPLVQLKPWCPSVEEMLRYDYMAFPRKGGRPKLERRNLYHLDPRDGCGYFPVAMSPEVMEELEGLGHTVEYLDTRDLKALYPPPLWDRVSPLRSGQREVLEAVVNNDQGLIVCGTGFGKSFCIVQLCKMYPTLRFIVAAPGIAEMANLHDALVAELGEEQVGRLGGGKEIPSRRVTVSTMQSLGKADFKSCGIFMFDEAHSLGNNKTTFSLLGRLEDSRVYGFTATPSGRSDKSDAVIRAVFGRELVNYTYADCERAGAVTPIEVWVYTIDGEVASSTSPFGSTFVANKRNFYWRNEYRNVCIATLARAIPPDQQTLVMVEAVDHLVNIGQYLPEFALVCGAGNDLAARARKRRIKLDNRLGGDPAENQAIYREFKAGSLTRAISSMTWKQGVSFDGLNILIRGDGGAGKISATQIPGRLSRLSPGKDVAILIDFLDLFNPTAKAHSYARIRNYRRNGWRVVMKGDPLDEQFKRA